MQLLKVLIGLLFTMPALAHHEASTSASAFDGYLIAIVSALVLIAIIATVKALPQLKAIKSSENKK